MQHLERVPDVARIVVADTHTIVRDGLRRILELEPGLHVVGEAGSGHVAIEIVRALQPDLLLLDIRLPGLPSLDVVRALGASAKATAVVLFTSDLRREDAIAAVQLGVRGIVSKDAPVELLLRCIRLVLSGDHWLERQLLADAVRISAREDKSFGLSPRELDIVAAIVSGACNKEVAQKLNISELTVKRHLTNIYEKAGVSGRLELALFALSHNLGCCRKLMAAAVTILCCRASRSIQLLTRSSPTSPRA